MFSRLKKLFKLICEPDSIAPKPPTRKVVRRYITDAGEEVITLECGHQFLLKAHRISAWACLDCPVENPDEVVTARREGKR